MSQDLPTQSLPTLSLSLDGSSFLHPLATAPPLSGNVRGLRVPPPVMTALPHSASMPVLPNGIPFSDYLSLSSSLQEEHEIPDQYQQEQAGSPKEKILSKELKFHEEDHEYNLRIGEDGYIKAATYSKLIEKLTSTNSLQLLGGLDVSSFLLTYRSYSNPEELLDALILRFNTAQNDSQIIRLRVIQIIKTWIDKYWYDFSSAEITQKTLDFFEVSSNQPDMAKIIQPVQRKLRKKMANVRSDIKNTEGPQPPAPILQTGLTTPSGEIHDLMQVHPEELARQLTLFDWTIWSQIKPWECLDPKEWQKKKKKNEQVTNNVQAMTEHFNRVSGWVATTICLCEGLRHRVKVFKKFLDIAEFLRKMGNFNGVMEILSGLNNAATFRLKQTLKGVTRDKDYERILTDIQSLTDAKKSYTQLREAYRTTNPPIIPYMGMYQTDLTFILDGNKTIIWHKGPNGENIGLVNYAKCRLVSERIKSIQQYQLTPYNFIKVNAIQAKLESLPVLDDNTLWQLSQYLEPSKESIERPGILDLHIDAIISMTSSDRVDFKLEIVPGWPFYTPDTAQNLVVDADTRQINAATIEKYVEHLTHHKLSDQNSLLPFLANYRSVLSPRELFSLIKQRFYMPNPEDKSQENMEQFHLNMKGPIVLHIANFLKSWVCYFWSDFKENRELFLELEEFMKGPFVKTSATASGLQALIEKKLQFQDKPTILSTPLPRIPDKNITQHSGTIMAFDPIEAARQFTLDAYTQVISKINPHSLVEEAGEVYDLEFVFKMVQGKGGFEVKDRWKNFKTYTKVFVASEACDWFIKNLNMSHAHAIMWGNYYQQLGVIENISGKSEFEDNDEFWRFCVNQNDIEREQLKKLFDFTVGDSGPVTALVNGHLAHIQRFVLAEIDYGKQCQAADLVIRFFILIAKELVKINNWHSLQGIVGALQKTLTKKNRSLWEKLPSEDIRWFIDFRSSFLAPEQLRNMISVPPCTPCIFIYLNWIKQLERVHGPVLIDGLVNIRQLLAVGNAVLSFVRVQRAPPAFDVVPAVQEYLSHAKVVLDLSTN